MSQAMGRRFGIINSKPCKFTNYLQPNKINWTIDPKELQGLKSHHLRLIDNKRYLSSLQSADLERSHPEDVLYVSTNVIYFHALIENPHYKKQLLWASQMSYGNLFAKMMNLLFRFNNHIQEKFDKFFKVNIPEPNMHLVCAQIRIGQNPSVPGDSPRNSMSNIQIVWNLLNKYNTSKYKIFVTTDSEEVQAIASNKFASQIANNSGEIFHVDRIRNGVNKICDNLSKVFMDQYILTKCDTLIVSRSGYGENAVIMRQKENNLFYFRNGNITRISKEKLSRIWKKTWL
uniref:GT23 domain-containing protein n=2 Tax=Octopus bimaculoides TaxID=37653 RepID=A0A0L8HSX1_OCTBM